ncbi:MAG TPA: hypothetical protein DHV77_03475 [Erysipelotrichaceae bacterium]|nr:hypothetical protein [Erysipelotrichaceae bacterium]
MKKVAIIGRWLNDSNVAGIHRFTLEILKELDKIVNTNEVELLIPISESAQYDFSHINVIQLGKKIPGKIGQRIEGYLYKNYYVPKYIRKKRMLSVDMLLQFPLFRCDIIAIYDCRINKFPEYYTFSKAQKRIYRAMLRHQNKAVSNCKTIITDSFTAAKDIQDCYPKYNKPINVIYCGWQHFMDIAEEENILQRLELQKNGFFFSLGSRFPHKNVKWISAAARKHPEYKFVISGKQIGDSQFEGNIQPNMVFAGRLSDAEIKTLMHYCKAFIQPSLYEGFGIPPLEAMSVGANCMVSDIPVFREVYKESVWYIDPLDYEDINLDNIMLKQKKDNDAVLNQYSWKESAQKLWEILKDIQ